MMRPVTKFSAFEHHCALAGAPTVQPIPMSEGRTVASIHNPLLIGKPKFCLCRVEKERVSSSSKHITAISQFAEYAFVAISESSSGRLIFNVGYSVSDNLHKG